MLASARVWYPPRCRLCAHFFLFVFLQGSRDTTPDWQPRKVPFFGSAVVAASATSAVTVCLTANHMVFVLRDFSCVRLPNLPSPFVAPSPFVNGDIVVNISLCCAYSLQYCECNSCCQEKPHLRFISCSVFSVLFQLHPRACAQCSHATSCLQTHTTPGTLTSSPCFEARRRQRLSRRSCATRTSCALVAMADCASLSPTSTHYHFPHALTAHAHSL